MINLSNKIIAYKLGFLLILKCVYTDDSKIFHIGLVCPWGGFQASGSHSAGAIHIVLEDIRSDDITFREIHNSGHDFKFTYADTKCDPSFGIPRIAELISGNGDLSKKVDVFIGPVCSVVCEPGGYLARHWNIPMISFRCVSDLLSDKSVYPTFARTTGPNSSGAAYVKLMQVFNFKRIAIFTSSESFMVALATTIRELSVAVGIQVTDFLSIGGRSTGQRSDSFKDLALIRERSKGIICKTRCTINLKIKIRLFYFVYRLSL